MRAWDESPGKRWAVIAALLLVVVLVRSSVGAVPACDPSVPQPPLIVVLPDGTEVPAGSLSYRPDSRSVVVTGWDGVFCNGFESPG